MHRRNKLRWILAGLALPTAVAVYFVLNWALASGPGNLHEAAAQGDISAIKEMLESKKANIEGRNSSGQTPLIIAAAMGQDQAVELLVEHKANINAADKSRRTALWEAAQKGRTAIVRLLLDCGASAGTADNQGITPLMTAADHGGADVAGILLARGAPIDEMDNDGRTALMHAALCRLDDNAMARILAFHAALDLKDKQAQTALDMAVQARRPDTVNELLAAGAAAPADALYKGTNIMRAVYWGQIIEGSRLIAEASSSEINATDNYGRTALMRVRDEVLPLGQMLLDRGANVNATDNAGNTALIHAAMLHQKLFAELLLSRHADPELKNKQGLQAADLWPDVLSTSPATRLATSPASSPATTRLLTTKP